MSDRRGRQNPNKGDSFRPDPPKERGKADFTPLRHPRYPRLNAGEPPGTRARRLRQAQIDSLKEEPMLMTSTAPAGSRVVRRVSSTLRQDFRTGRIPLLIAFVVVVGVLYWFLTAQNFKVTNIKITGSRYLDAKGLTATVDVTQQNVFLLNENEVADKLRQKPYIMDVKVSKSFPNELKVEVTERTTGALWKVGNVYYMVSPDGVVLESTIQPSQDMAKLPVINSLDTKAPVIGTKVDSVAVGSASEILEKLAAANIKVFSLDHSPTTGLIIVSAGEDGKPGPWKALLGTNAELEKKINLLKALLVRSDIKWTFADLRFTEKPAIS